MKTHAKKKAYRRMIGNLQRAGHVNKPDGSWTKSGAGQMAAFMTNGASHRKVV